MKLLWNLELIKNLLQDHISDEDSQFMVSSGPVSPTYLLMELYQLLCFPFGNTISFLFSFF